MGIEKISAGGQEFFLQRTTKYDLERGTFLKKLGYGKGWGKKSFFRGQNLKKILSKNEKGKKYCYFSCDFVEQGGGSHKKNIFSLLGRIKFHFREGNRVFGGQPMGIFPVPFPFPMCACLSVSLFVRIWSPNYWMDPKLGMRYPLCPVGNLKEHFWGDLAPRGGYNFGKTKNPNFPGLRTESFCGTFCVTSGKVK